MADFIYAKAVKVFRAETLKYRINNILQSVYMNVCVLTREAAYKGAGL